MSQAFVVELEEQPIELCNLLKLLDLVESGGQAKMLIADGYVTLNGELCLQKRKKVFAGDAVEFDGQRFQIAELSSDHNDTCTQDTDSPKYDEQHESEDVVEHQQVTQAPNAASSTNNQSPNNANYTKKKPSPKNAKAKDKKTGRKPISFG